ncbi:hypothetical protein BJ912DRAFT_1144268 [Pholiota molesta]|nr:hypothetical protein BJ912DRAFT_1144268 [Pholiota molesta]
MPGLVHLQLSPTVPHPSPGRVRISLCPQQAPRIHGAFDGCREGFRYTGAIASNYAVVCEKGGSWNCGTGAAIITNAANAPFVSSSLQHFPSSSAAHSGTCRAEHYPLLLQFWSHSICLDSLPPAFEARALIALSFHRVA